MFCAFSVPRPPPLPPLPPRRLSRFAGMSYEQASRKGLELVAEAAATGAWCAIVDDLDELRKIMKATAP